MRKKVLTILGVLLVAVSASRMEKAAGRSVLKKTGAPHPQTQQLRDGFALTARWDRSNHTEQHGLSSLKAVENKSCDIIWCYEN